MTNVVALPYREDLSQILLLVRRCGDNQEPIQKINGNAVWALVICSTDSGKDRNYQHLISPNSVNNLLKER